MYIAPSVSISFTVNADISLEALSVINLIIRGRIRSQVVVSKAQNKSNISISLYFLKYGQKRRINSFVLFVDIFSIFKTPYSI